MDAKHIFLTPRNFRLQGCLRPSPILLLDRLQLECHRRISLFPQHSDTYEGRSDKFLTKSSSVRLGSSPSHHCTRCRNLVRVLRRGGFLLCPQATFLLHDPHAGSHCDCVQLVLRVRNWCCSHVQFESVQVKQYEHAQQGSYIDRIRRVVRSDLDSRIFRDIQQHCSLPVRVLHNVLRPGCLHISLVRRQKR